MASRFESHRSNYSKFQLVSDTERFEEETAEKREPELEGIVTPEGIEVPRRIATWERETPKSAKKMHEIHR